LLTVRSRWRAAVLLSIDQLVAWGALYYAYSIVSLPIARELHVSRVWVGAACSGALLVSGLLAPRVGRALDLYGARSVMIAGAIIGAIALAGIAIAPTLGALMAAFAALGLAQALGLYDAAFAGIVDYFDDPAERARAMVLLTIVGGLASVVFLPLLRAGVAQWGWRAVIAALAAMFLAVVLPLRIALPRSRITTRAPASEPRPSRAMTWLSVAFALHAFVSAGISTSIVWYLATRGETFEAAAWLAALAGGSQIPARIVLPAFLRSVNVELRVPMWLALQALAILVIVIAPRDVSWAGLVVLGAANGMMTIERPAIVLAWFGSARFGARSSTITSMSTIARAVGPFAIELAMGSAGYAVLACVMLLASVIAIVAVRRRRLDRSPSSGDRRPGNGKHSIGGARKPLHDR
jgi:predicted MFS family arabinose efflux permease